MRLPQDDTTPSDALQRMWPVGSIFLSAVATDPAVLMGFGVWAAIGSGRVLVGQDTNQTEFDVLGETGGAKTVTLTANEMPAHTHVQDPHTHTQNAHTHVQDPHSHVENINTAITGGAVGFPAVADTSTSGSQATGLSTAATTATNQNATAVNQNSTATNQSTGGGAAHANLPPYLVVKMWQRTA